MKIRIPLFTLSALIVTMACSLLTPLPVSSSAQPAIYAYRYEPPISARFVGTLRLVGANDKGRVLYAEWRKP